jgi:hypothetical protein
MIPLTLEEGTGYNRQSDRNDDRTFAAAVRWDRKERSTRPLTASRPHAGDRDPILDDPVEQLHQRGGHIPLAW